MLVCSVFRTSSTLALSLWDRDLAPEIFLLWRVMRSLVLPWEAWRLFCEKCDHVSGMLMVVSIFSMPPWRFIPLWRNLKCKMCSCLRDNYRELLWNPRALWSVVYVQSWILVVKVQLQLMSCVAIGVYLLVDLQTKFSVPPNPHKEKWLDVQSSVDLWACSACWRSGWILDRVCPPRHLWPGLSPFDSLSCRCSRRSLEGVAQSL